MSGVMRSATLLVALLLCCSLVDAAYQTGGDWCVCGQQGRRCDPAVLRFRPHDGTPSSSYLQPEMPSHFAGGLFPVIIDRPMLPVVVQAMDLETVNTTAAREASIIVPQTPTSGAIVQGGVASSVAWRLLDNIIDPLVQVDNGFKMVASVVTSDPSVIVTNNEALAEFGQFTFPGISVSASSTGSVGATGYFNFTVHPASGGGPAVAWITSPQFALRINPSSNAGTSNFRLKFRQFFSYFTTNYVLNEEVVVLDRPLPSISVVLLVIGDYPSETENNQIVTVTASYVSGGVGNITVLNNRATMKGSVATFTGITITNDTVANAEFRLTFALGSDKRMVSHVLRGAEIKAPNHRLVLGGEAESFLSFEDKPFFAQKGTKLPPIVVYLVDTAREIDTTSTGTFVTARCLGGVVTGEKAVVRDGRAVFTDLTFTALRNSPSGQRSLSLTFVAGDQEQLQAAGHPIYSPPISVFPTKPNRAVGLRFRQYSGYIRYSSASLLATRSMVTPRIIVEQFGSDNRVFPQRSAEVRLTSIPEDAVRGTTSVLLDEGVAIFKGVSFLTKEALQEVSLKFALAGVGELQAGPIIVRDALRPATALRFEESSVSLFSAEGQDTFATQNTVLPPIVIEILNSDGELDTTADEVVVTAKANVFAENLVSVSQAGRVVFDRLVFGSAGSSRLQFTATSPSGHGVNGQSLWSGFISIEASVLPRYHLGFSRDSYLHHRGQEVVTALNPARVPPIGVYVQSSDHVLDTSAVNVIVECTVSGHTLTTGSTTVVAADATSRIAWFDDLVFSTGFPSEPQLHFTARFNNTDSNVDHASRVVGRTVSSGVVNFVSLGDPLLLDLVPYDGSKSSYPARNSTSTANASRVTILNDATSSPKFFYPSETIIEVAFAMKSANDLNVLPPTDAETGVTATSSLKLSGDRVDFNPYSSYVAGTTPITATFDGLEMLGPTPYIEGFFYMLTITSEWIAERPAKIGPFYDLTMPTDQSQPVVVAEVMDRAPSFSIDRWLSSLGRLMNIPASRMEVTKLRDGGSSSTDFDYEWEGTRVELRFLSPTTASEDKASSRALAEMFIGMTETESLKLLKIRKKFLRIDDDGCDLFRIEEQIAAAKRCVSTSTADERCGCHVPLFELLGDRCKETGPILGVCSQLRRCTSPIIEDPCFAFETQVYIQYLLIATYTLLAALAIYLLWAWRTGRFSRAARRKLSGKAVRKHQSAKLVIPTDQGTKALDVVL